MAFTLTHLTEALNAPFDSVIDVRAPSEFAEDHMPGAINLPVLSDAERAKVGTIYVRQDRFLARKVGAALVARNAAHHIETALSQKDGGWRPLVYCWRGGQRSGSFASILSQIGWRVAVVDGGYRSYRRLVADRLYDQPLGLEVILLDGGTGTAKTQLLRHLSDAGAQTLDLEALAEHRGSNFGGLPGGQPAQKMFESRLAQALLPLDPARPVFLEAESNAIGAIKLPPALWTAMRAAPVIQVTAPLAARARHLLTAYPDLGADLDLLTRRIDSLRPYHPRTTIAAWQELAQTGRLHPLAEALIAAHYDPRYRRAARAQPRLADIVLSDLTPADLDRAAARILDLSETRPA
ncbi:MAG: tRNA 2-selenouridine(34) synthase MnmH [Pseudomonadota bacterium]